MPCWTLTRKYQLLSMRAQAPGILQLCCPLYSGIVEQKCSWQIASGMCGKVLARCQRRRKIIAYPQTCLAIVLALLCYAHNTPLPLEYYLEVENGIASVPSTVQSKDGPCGDLLYFCYSVML